MDASAAADVAARLRNIGLGGRLLGVRVRPALSRPLVREARLVDARRRRDTTVGFLRRGVLVDEEGRMSLTPEVLALAIADRVTGKTVLDAGCGVGGNAIAFARRGCSVIAVDLNAERLEMARHNARIYDVANRIVFVHGDALEVAESSKADVLFVDPPWGAEWNRTRTALADFPLLDVLSRGAPHIRERLYKVPPSFDPATCSHMTPHAVFGEETGDYRRLKFVLLTS